MRARILALLRRCHNGSLLWSLIPFSFVDYFERVRTRLRPQKSTIVCLRTSVARSTADPAGDDLLCASRFVLQQFTRKALHGGQ